MTTYGQAHEKTLKLLASSRNTSSSQALSVGLTEATDANLRDRIVSILIDRPDQPSREALIRSFQLLRESDKNCIRTQRKSHFEPAIKRLLNSRTGIVGAIAATVDFRFADGFMDLIELAEREDDEFSSHAVNALLTLSYQLGDEARTGNDTPSIRQALQSQLLESVQRYEQHRNLAMLDSFLLCSHADDATLRSLIKDSGSQVNKLIRRQLRLSRRGGVPELLADMFTRRDCPEYVRQILCERSDAPLAMAMLKNAARKVNAATARYLKRQPVPACLAKQYAERNSMDIQYQCALFTLMIPTLHPDRDLLLDAIELLETGHALALQTVSNFLKTTDRFSFDTVLDGLNEPTPVAQPVATIHTLGQAMQYLLRKHGNMNEPTVKFAIRSFFKGFTFENALNDMERLGMERMFGYAEAVVAVQPEWESELLVQLDSISPLRRTRGLCLVPHFPLTDNVWEHCETLVDDQAIRVRLQAIEAITYFQRPEVPRILESLMLDDNRDVQKAAEVALRRHQTRAASRSDASLDQSISHDAFKQPVVRS